MFMIVLDMRLEQLLIKEVAFNKDNLNLYFNNIITYRFFSSIFIILVFLAIIIYSSYSERIKVALFIVLFFFISTMFLTFFRAFFRAYEKIKYESISIVIEKLYIILFAFIGLIVNGLFGFLIGLLFGNLLSLSYCVYFLFKKVPSLVFKPIYISINKLLKNALPFLVADLFTIIYFRLCSVMIMFITNSIVGIATIINIITNYFLIQKFNYIGACYAIVMTESLITIIYYINIRKYFGGFTLRKFNLKLGSVLIIFGSIYYLSMYYSISILITLLIFILLYLILLFIFRIVEISQLKNYYKLIREK